MIINKFGNNVNVTERTLAEQAVQDAPEVKWRRTFQNLRQRYPGADMMELIWAVDNAIAEAQTLEQQLADAIERTDATIAKNEHLLAAYRQECYEAGYSAFLDGDSGGYAPGKNQFWFEGYDAASAAEYEACRERDDIGREESLYPWRI